ncbi:hypothetical protein H9660_13480 [Clostridium sp. Sa3CUN1]|uniref:Permuted papain-like amidase enzyme, YaeF/YiiX, C92 family n=1 Tax=Clostridium gallinarum TaxID=2762246 RepID=A0ABR8Q6U8_9CLOT|nr:hypothetical protein [Clostridium gallinarum]MBD7916157.1 hypothetical protein [Clostridium gallinarum]
MGKKNIYLVFSNTGTILAKCINYYTKDKYVHVSLSLDETFEKMYSFGRIYPRNPFIGGLVEENLKDGVYKNFQNSECIIYRVQVTDEQYVLLKKELDLFLKDQKKYKYSLLGLLGVIMNRPIKRSNRYFCSEFVSYLLIKSNIYDSNKIPSLTKPSDLLNINDKEFIYEGLTYEYKVG